MKLRIHTGLLLLILTLAPFANDINTGGQLGVNKTLSAYSQGRGSLFTGVSFKGAFDNEFVQVTDSTGTTTEGAGLLSENLFFGIGLTHWLDISLDLPFYQDLWDGVDYNTGIGDLGLGIKLIHPGLKADATWRIAYYLGAQFPTGSTKNGYFARHSYYTSPVDSTANYAFTSTGYSFNPEVLFTFDFRKGRKLSPFMLHLNMGATVLVHTSKKDNRPTEFSALLGSINFEYLPKEHVSLFLELNGEARLFRYTRDLEVTDFNNDLLDLTLGTTIKNKSGLYQSYALTLGLTDEHDRTSWEKHGYSYTTAPFPRFGASVTLGFRRLGNKSDSDFDGVPLISDSCPFVTEDFDGYQDEDGCAEAGHRVDTVYLTDTTAIIKVDTLRIVEKELTEKIVTYNVITMRAINFKPNSAWLTYSSNKAIKDLASSLKAFPEVRIEIRGHTDSVGTTEANQELSYERALAVAQALVEEGISKRRLKPIGMGESDPMADNGTHEGRKLNRRVDIKRAQDLPSETAEAVVTTTVTPAAKGKETPAPASPQE